jgi:murein L,D-transpeptidase YafK
LVPQFCSQCHYELGSLAISLQNKEFLSMKDSEVVQKTTVTNLNWHNAWNNGYINTNLTTIFNKLEEGFNFKEKLSNDKVSTSINLLLEVKQIFLIATTVRMALWIT